MRKIFAEGQSLLWFIPLIIGLGIAALFSLTLSSPGLADEPDYFLYMPLVAKPLPTPTCTPTATPTPLPLDVRVEPACSNFKGGTAQDPTGEWVCFKNYDIRPADMTNWYVEDEALHRYTFPPFVLNPGAIVRLHSGLGSDTATDLYWGRNILIWNNDHDTVSLYNSLGNLVNRYRY
nr:lamin tail domain-containing protein [Chloroflexota bacterium]